MSALAKETEIIRHNIQNTQNYTHLQNTQNLSNIYINDEGDGGIEVRGPRGIEDIPLPTDRSNYEGAVVIWRIFLLFTSQLNCCFPAFLDVNLTDRYSIPCV
jgi:hypothetical protein